MLGVVEVASLSGELIFTGDVSVPALKLFWGSLILSHFTNTCRTTVTICGFEI